ncbi:diguanylate cyclase [Luteibacter sp. PPL201]|uniref:diguanylate cyclase n=1 Tax=Luteibacter sahnii TaxID=3021977 RepID=A0ABT6BBY9_9GAMM
MEWIAKLAHAGTLLIVNALLAALSSAFFLALYLAYPRARRQAGVLLWTLGYMAFAVGFSVLVLPGLHVRFAYMGLVGNLAIDAGAVLGLLAVNTYLKLSRGRLWVLVPVAMLAVTEAWVVLRLGEQLRLMVILGGALTAVLALATGVAFWECQDEPRRPVARLAGAFHVLWAVMLLVRMAWWIAHPAADPGHDPTSTFGLLSRILLTWVLTPAVLWMLTRQLDAELIRYASQDPLTGISNRRVMWERGQHRAAESRRGHTALAVLMIDVDHFKAINDRWGHDGGDHILVSLAGTLQANVRAGDLLARVGGEEFMVLIHDASPQAVTDAAERLRAAVERDPVALPSGERWPCTVSIGYCLATCGEAGWSDVVIAADKALYAAKRAGRNRVMGETMSHPSLGDGANGGSPSPEATASPG